jgi:SMODS and SLOG-associating 2TM effector domain 1
MSDQPTPEVLSPAPQHTKVEQALLYNAYLQHRIEVQKRFYRDRINENVLNSDFSFNMATAIMAITSFISLASAVIGSPVVTLVGALLPSLAATLAAFRQLYGWDRQTRIYQDAIRGLERSGLLIPDNDELPKKDLTKVYPPLVTAIEEVFKGEISQWGQFLLEKDKQSETEAARDPFNRMIASMNLSEDQITKIRRIIDAGKTPT